MGPAMHGAAEVLNEWIRLWMAVTLAVLLGAMAIALAAGELLHLMRRRSSGEEACRAFADAVSREDLEAAEEVATLAFARNVRGGSVERVHRGGRGRHRGHGYVVEMTWIGSRHDHP